MRRASPCRERTNGSATAGHGTDRGVVCNSAGSPAAGRLNAGSPHPARDPPAHTPGALASSRAPPPGAMRAALVATVVAALLGCAGQTAATPAPTRAPSSMPPRADGEGENEGAAVSEPAMSGVLGEMWFWIVMVLLFLCVGVACLVWRAWREDAQHAAERRTDRGLLTPHVLTNVGAEEASQDSQQEVKPMDLSSSSSPLANPSTVSLPGRYHPSLLTTNGQAAQHSRRASFSTTTPRGSFTPRGGLDSSVPLAHQRYASRDGPPVRLPSPQHLSRTTPLPTFAATAASNTSSPGQSPNSPPTRTAKRGSSVWNAMPREVSPLQQWPQPPTPPPTLLVEEPAQVPSQPHSHSRPRSEAVQM